MLVKASDLWLKVPEIPMRSVENTVTDLHNASLISNDVEDDSDLRGRQIATYLVFEHGQTIDSTKFMLVRVVWYAFGPNNEFVVPLFVRRP